MLHLDITNTDYEAEQKVSDTPNAKNPWQIRIPTGKFAFTGGVTGTLKAGNFLYKVHLYNRDQCQGESCKKQRAHPKQQCPLDLGKRKTISSETYF